jgi:hypothetical protein
LEYNGNMKEKDPVEAIMVFTNYASAPIEQ